MIEEVLKELYTDEGFLGSPYNDHLGNPTIGYGTLLPISQKEAVLLAEYRLINKENEIKRKKPFYKELPDEAKKIILNMVYQMGVNGVIRFKRMWEALEAKNYDLASKEMLDSVWALQTQHRASRLAYRMRNV